MGLRSRITTEGLVFKTPTDLPLPSSEARSVSSLASSSINPEESSITPFRSLKRPLQFLGLFETSLCRLSHIPAYKVKRE